VLEAQGLEEVHYGRWAGMRFEDLVDDPEYLHYREHPLTTPTPGGETIGQVQERGVKTILRMVEAHPKKRILFVSHGDIIRTVLCHFLGAELEHFRRIRIDNATFSAVQLIGDFAEVKFMNLLPDPERAFLSPFQVKLRK
jgi:broad specificity phosphatase PhoE